MNKTKAEAKLISSESLRASMFSAPLREKMGDNI